MPAIGAPLSPHCLNAFVDPIVHAGGHFLIQPTRSDSASTHSRFREAWPEFLSHHRQPSLSDALALQMLISVHDCLTVLQKHCPRSNLMLTFSVLVFYAAGLSRYLVSPQKVGPAPYQSSPLQAFLLIIVFWDSLESYTQKVESMKSVYLEKLC